MCRSTKYPFSKIFSNMVASQIDISFTFFYFCSRFLYAFCTTKPAAVVPIRRAVVEAVGTPEMVGIGAVPRPAPQHPILPMRRWLQVTPPVPIICLALDPVLHPLPDVPRHLVQSIRNTPLRVTPDG